MPAFEEITAGDTASCEMLVDSAAIDAFARLSYDDNPLHMNTEFAREHGFGDRVAHGMLALSAISRLIGTRLPGPGALWISQDFQFVTPVLAGDTIQAKVTVQGVSQAARIITLQTEVLNATRQAVVLRGTAKVRVPQATAH